MTHIFRSLFLGWLLLVLIPLGAFGFQKGDVVPDIEQESIDGEVFRLYDQKGEAFLLNLGATWCPGCRGQSIQIEGIYEFLEGKNIPVIEVFHQDTEEAVRESLKALNHQVKPLALLDEGQVRKRYNVFMIPRLIILNRDFQVVYDGGPLMGPEIIQRLEETGGDWGE